jgi:hypothetical protein
MAHITAILSFFVAIFFAFFFIVGQGAVSDAVIGGVLLYTFIFGLPALAILGLYYILFRANWWATAALPVMSAGAFLAAQQGLLGADAGLLILIGISVAAAIFVHHIVLNLMRTPSQQDA